METLENRIITAARGWLGTRFAHQGRLKRTAAHKGGVDCLGLLIGVAHELGLKSTTGAPLAALDSTDYGHLPDGIALKVMLDAHLAPAARPQPGCILLLAPDGVARHLGIVGCTVDGALTLIHAYAQARCVAEHTLDVWWGRVVAGCYQVGNGKECQSCPND